MSIVRSSLVVLALALTAQFSVPAALAQDAVLTQTANDMQYQPLGDLPWFGDAVAITDSVAYVGIPGYRSAPGSNVVGGRVAIYKPNATHTTWQRTGSMDLVSTHPEDGDFGSGLATQSTATTNYMAVASHSKIRIFAKTGSAPWQKISDYTLTLNASTYYIQDGSLVWNGDTLAFTYFQIDQQAMGSFNVVLLKVTPTYQLQDVQTLLPPSGYEGSWGFGVSIDGDQMAIGAGGDSGSANGYVQLFTRGSNGLWQSSSILPAPNTGGGFGWGVSLNGNHMVVGAQDEDPDTSNGFDRSGAAYVYIRQRGQWMLTQRLRPDLDAPQLVGSFSRFGACMVANSQFVAIVAPFEASPPGETGHVGLYEWIGNQLVLLKWRAPLSGNYSYMPPSMSAHYAIVGAPDAQWPKKKETADIVELY